MVFQVKNESKIGSFKLSGEMDSACIATKNGQCAFLTAEKWAVYILNSRKTGRVHFEKLKNRQGAEPS